MKASELIKVIQDIIKLEGGDPEIYYSKELGDGKEVTINSIGYGVDCIILCNEEEPEED